MLDYQDKVKLLKRYILTDWLDAAHAFTRGASLLTFIEASNQTTVLLSEHFQIPFATTGPLNDFRKTAQALEKIFDDDNFAGPETKNASEKHFFAENYPPLFLQLTHQLISECNELLWDNEPFLPYSDAVALQNQIVARVDARFDELTPR